MTCGHCCRFAGSITVEAGRVHHEIIEAVRSGNVDLVKHLCALTRDNGDFVTL